MGIVLSGLPGFGLSCECGLCDLVKPFWSLEFLLTVRQWTVFDYCLIAESNFGVFCPGALGLHW